MNTKIITAAIVGSIVSFFLGWLIFGNLLMGFYEENTMHYEGMMRHMPVFWAIFLSGLASSFLFAMILSRTPGGNTFKGGFTTILWVGFLLCLSFDLMMYAMYHLMRVRLLIADVLLSSLFFAVIGGVIGYMLGREKTPVPAV
jgi:hypothetical protein